MTVDMQYDAEPRCNLSDLFKSQCHHCTMGYPTLGPIDGGLYLEDLGGEECEA